MYIYIFIIKHICVDIGSYVYLYYLFDESIITWRYMYLYGKWDVFINNFYMCIHDVCICFRFYVFCSHYRDKNNIYIHYKYFFAWRVSTIVGKLEVQLIFLEGESMGVLSGLCWVSMGGRRGEVSESVIFCQLKSDAVLTFDESSFPWWLWKVLKSKRWIFVCHACFQQGNAVIINQYPHQAELAKGWKTVSKSHQWASPERWSFILEKVNAIISNKKHPCGWETASICSHQNKVINNNCNLSRSYPSPQKKA